MLNVHIGHSADIDLDICVDEVIAQVGDVLRTARSAAALLFVAESLDHIDVVSRINRAFPGLKLVGCTSDGEASTALGFQEDSILLIAFTSPDLHFAIGFGRDASVDSAAASDRALTMIRDQIGAAAPRLCFMFVDSLLSLPDEGLRRVVSSLGPDCRVVGDAANPSSVNESTPVFFGDRVLSDSVVLLAVMGEVQTAVTAFSSWQPIGSPGRITKAEGSVIREINGRPAVEFYTRDLGVSAQMYIGVPLALVDANGEMALRAPLLHDATEGSLRVASEVFEGQEVRVCYATQDDIFDGAARAAERTRRAFGDRDPAAVLFCSCVVRKMFLSLDVETEVEHFKERFGQQVPVAGFYAFGEIGGATAAENLQFRNQAIVALAVA